MVRLGLCTFWQKHGKGSILSASCQEADDNQLSSFLGDQNQEVALADVAQWVERQPADLKVTGSIPGQGTRLGCGPGPRLGVFER